MNAHNKIWLSLFFIISAHITCAQRAFICVPVADLSGQPVASLNKALATETLYASFPEYAKGAACPRLHQALFNEQVEILDTKGDEINVSIASAFYETPQSSAPQTRYWTLKKNCLPLPSDAESKIPTPYAFKKTSEKSHPTITLIEPFYDSKTMRTFSAGTRFVHVPSKKTKKEYRAYVFDPQQNSWLLLAIPREICIEEHTNNNREKQITGFVATLRRWAQNKNGIIPYVFGGCSYGTRYANESFTKNTDKLFGTRNDRYERAPNCVKVGLDCAGLILRAAQLNGIPYFLKNSSTIAKRLRPLAPDKTVSIGDIIWVPGHVMIVSDLSNNMLIEARGHTHGYGKVQEIPLNKVFKGIETYADLAAAFFNKKPIVRIRRDGSCAETFRDFKILKLASVWDIPLA